MSTKRWSTERPWCSPERLTNLDWPTARVADDLRGEIQRLKETSSAPLRTVGSPTLVRQLIDASLVDNLLLVTFPLFPGPAGRELGLHRHRLHRPRPHRPQGPRRSDSGHDLPPDGKRHPTRPTLRTDAAPWVARARGAQHERSAMLRNGAPHDDPAPGRSASPSLTGNRSSPG